MANPVQPIVAQLCAVVCIVLSIWQIYDFFFILQFFLSFSPLDPLRILFGSPGLTIGGGAEGDRRGTGGEPEGNLFFRV